MEEVDRVWVARVLAADAQLQAVLGLASEPGPQGEALVAGAAREALDAVVVEGSTGRRLGDPRDALLVSVRSGARESMPGMLDTILNLGPSGTPDRRPCTPPTPPW
jgi:hypothetical protein